MNAARRIHRYRSRRASGGFAIISAVFLIIVLALLGAMIVSLSSTQQVSQVRDMDGSRAYFAARAGLEWGVYRVLHDSNCPASATMPALAGSASGFAIAVTCATYPTVDEGGTTVSVYQITSTATKGTFGALNYVDRQMQAVISTP